MNGISKIPLLMKSARCCSLVCLMLFSMNSRAFSQQALTLSASQVTVQAGQVSLKVVHIIGGAMPFSFAFSNENARILETSPMMNFRDLHIRGLKPGESVLTVKDAKGQTATMKVTVPALPPLKVNPAEMTVKPGPDLARSQDQNGTFTISGGLPPYTFASSSDAATLGHYSPSNGQLGFWGHKPGVTVVTFKDALGQSATAKITVEGSPLVLDPVALTVKVGADKTLLVRGTKPFSFTQSNDNAQISERLSGLTIHGAKPGETSVTVTDALGKTARATVTVEPGMGYKAEDPITVGSPRAGDSWAMGASQTISWTWKGTPPGPDAKLWLHTAELGKFSETITMKTPMGSGNSGSFVWRLPNVPAGTNYIVTITSTQNEGFRGNSGQFTIAPPKPPTPLATPLPDNFVLNFGAQAAAVITGGKPPYAVRSENPAIATASLLQDGLGVSSVSIMSKAKGTVRIVITDSGGQQLIRTIVVR
jgi:hypothetical protein